MDLTDGLRKEYEKLFATCKVRPERIATIDTVADKAIKNQKRYEAVAGKLKCPWFLIAAIHSLEAGQRFNAHLHNGDPLTARTVNVPAGRPKGGSAPFTWETSAEDALKGHGFHKIGTWTVPVMLFQLEKYNGFGYRNHHPEVLSPYLWSFTNHYTRGKFVADHKFDSKAVSKQVGGIALIQRLRDRKLITLKTIDLAGPAPDVTGPSVAAGRPPFPGVVLRRTKSSGADVCRVQAQLRALGHKIDQVPGCPFGPQTEAAVVAFQRKRGLTVDGKVGRNTWNALFTQQHHPTPAHA